MLSRQFIFCQNIFFFWQKKISHFLDAISKYLNAILYISNNSPLTVHIQFAHVLTKKWSLNIFSKYFFWIFFYYNILEANNPKWVCYIIFTKLRNLIITDCPYTITGRVGWGGGKTWCEHFQLFVSPFDMGGPWDSNGIFDKNSTSNHYQDNHRWGSVLRKKK